MDDTTKQGNAVDAQSMLRVSTLLNGKYSIEAYLSSGGFGNTYIARNVMFDEVVAVKEFFMKDIAHREGHTTVSVSNPDNQATYNGQLEKFKKEARRLRKLQNEHIVRVHDLFEENGTAYYVMDFVNGESLSARLKRVGALPELETLDILGQVLDALNAVHNAEQPILHLDLKPANIMLDAAGRVQVIDFGASKQVGFGGKGTTSSAISYTAGYAPSEQMEQNMDKFGPWTDFYALGATLYHLLTGNRPALPSDISEDRSPDKSQSLPMPQHISGMTQTIVRWLMAPNRFERPQSVAAIRDYMQRCGWTQGEKTVNIEDEKTKHQSKPKKEKQKVEEKQPTPKPTPKNRMLVLFLVAFVIVGGISIFALTQLTGGKNEASLASADSTVVTKDSVVNQSCTLNYGGATFTGVWTDEATQTGEGEVTYSTGTYTGKLVNGKMECAAGSFVFANGDSYEGSFANDHFSHGTYTVKSTGEYFVGEYDATSNPTKGTWYDANGNVLETVK